MENNKLRKPNEIILKDGRNLKEVLELHKKWLKDEEGGKKADLSGEDLSYANLYKADLSETNLSYANLYKADLTHANLYKADLRYSNLKYAKFYLTNLYKAIGDFVGVENIGSRHDTTHYFYKIDKVICGCFDGTMKEFIKQVEGNYGKDEVEYKEYMIAIEFLKRLAEIELER